MPSGNHLRQWTVHESLINAFKLGFFLCVTKPKIFIVFLTEYLQRIKDSKCSGIYHRKQVRGDIAVFYTANQKGNTVGVFPLRKNSWDHDDGKKCKASHAYASELFPLICFPFFFYPPLLQVAYYGIISFCFILYINCSKIMCMTISKA